MPSLSFKTHQDSLIVSGKTFQIKETLKLHGAKWNPDLGAWAIPLTLDSPWLREELEGIATERIASEKAGLKAQRDYAKSPAGIAATAASELQYAHGRGWTCCEKAYVVNVGRGTVGCLEHGFFVKGILRTGD